ncbi:methyltransferase domain-containing protein [Streptomyces albipurpureus]|uniref:Methyltransferase domain-containing protein n=1 Tax=Streptomyces albipurpureus TaxID=2897419 RepID=A0ABT0URD2_9ACTN|nr:methyltransferase domain-containing protein [Streptomyces sp. CWNU-1]MCM2390916.1 methyltransferase domain-containing protein [Streptomyces sp. CWNU-1]
MRTNDAQMLVLCTLADGPLHGYAINTAIEKLSGQRLGAGSLYGALARLEAKGLVEHLEGQGRRRPVRLTRQGRAVLEREAQSMARVTEHVFETAEPDRIGYLDRLAATDIVRSYQQVMLQTLDTRAGLSVLDLGCGPGTNLAALARAVGPTGTVTGVDISTEMVERARQRTAGLPGVDVRLGDVHALPLPDGSADRARADRTLQHVEDPAQALAEIHRVLRPGGRVVMGEPDWDSLAIDFPRLEISRAYTRHITDRIVRNGVIGRELPRLALAAGFTVADVIPVTSVFRDARAADDVLGLRRNTDRAVAAGYLAAQDAQEWLAHLAHGPFFAAVTLYVVVAEVERDGATGTTGGL